MQVDATTGNTNTSTTTAVRNIDNVGNASAKVSSNDVCLCQYGW